MIDLKSNTSFNSDGADELSTLLASALVRLSPQVCASLPYPDERSMVISEQNSLDECEKPRLHGAGS